MYLCKTFINTSRKLELRRRLIRSQQPYFRVNVEYLGQRGRGLINAIDNYDYNYIIWGS